ncbi:hypothetical protein TNCV_4575641 [Trichonephila clavipes]|nr:hypothetical protein TNCV_4575641 [Trichonephila clavipes]
MRKGIFMYYGRVLRKLDLMWIACVTFEKINSSGRVRNLNIWFIYVTATNCSTYIFDEVIQNIGYKIFHKNSEYDNCEGGGHATVLFGVFQRTPLHSRVLGWVWFLSDTSNYTWSLGSRSGVKYSCWDAQPSISGQ